LPFSLKTAQNFTRISFSNSIPQSKHATFLRNRRMWILSWLFSILWLHTLFFISSLTGITKTHFYHAIWRLRGKILMIAHDFYAKWVIRRLEGEKIMWTFPKKASRGDFECWGENKKKKFVSNCDARWGCATCWIIKIFIEKM
jgi:hypothetical protein